jgi:hypothetical protein
VIGDGAADQNRVSSAGPRRPEIDAIRDDADSGGVDVAAVAVAALDDFGIAGHDLDSGDASGRGHSLGDASQIGDREAFLENESGA